MAGLATVVLLVACVMFGTAFLTGGVVLLILTGVGTRPALSQTSRVLLASFVALAGVAMTVLFLSNEQLRLVYLSVVPRVGLLFGLAMLVLCARAARRNWTWRFATGSTFLGCALLAIPFALVLWG